MPEQLSPEKWLAADERRERWRGIGLLIAFAAMVCAVLPLCFLGDTGKPLGKTEYCLMALSLAPWLAYALVFTFWRRSAFHAIPLDCPTCEAALGDLHALGCTLEECPFCSGQLAACRCAHAVLGLTAAESAYLDSYGDDSVDPLKSILSRWESALEQKGRIPYGPKSFVAEILHDGVAKPTLTGIAIECGVSTAHFKGQDGRKLQVRFRKNNRGWSMEDA